MAKDIEAAVRAARLYIGCDQRVTLRDAQRLYTAMRKKIALVAKRRGMDELDAHEQVMTKARSEGGICPMPGKDL
jgi:hypothetical protein